MMHECPKCGFVQPQDRYCANCGLDIEHYKPTPSTLMQKLGKNTGLQIALVVGVVILLGAFIYFGQKELLEKHLAQTPLNLEAFETPTPADSSEESSDLISADQNQEESAPAGDEATAKPAAALNAKSATNEKRDIVITFAEASNSLLQQLAGEGQILNETAQRRSFLHPNIDSISHLKERDPEFKILPGGQTHSLTIGTAETLDFSHISGASNEDVGLNFDITPITNSENSVELNLSGTLHLAGEGGTSAASQEISANYVFSPNNTLLMVGFLPRQAIKQDDIPGFSNTPLAIFESLQFVNGLTDFVIFIQIK